MQTCLQTLLVSPVGAEELKQNTIFPAATKVVFHVTFLLNASRRCSVLFAESTALQKEE